MPTDEGMFYLDCDALDVGLGVVLSQKQGNSEVVIATPPGLYPGQNVTMMLHDVSF